MSEEQPSERKSILQNEFVRRWGFRVGSVLLAFLLGFVPTYISSRTNAANYAHASRSLRRQQVENMLASAVIDARRGEYEAARQSASAFFTEVRLELDDANSNIFNAEEKSKISSTYASRDEIITLLSRADSAGAERVSDFYVNHRSIVGKP